MPFDNQTQEVLDDIRSGVKSVRDDLDKKFDDLAEQQKVLAEKADQTDILNTMAESADALKKLQDAVDAQEEKLMRVSAASQSAKSLGQQLIESDEFKSNNVAEAPRNQFRFEAKDVTLAGNVATGVSRNVLVPEMQAGFIDPLQQNLTVRSLIPAGQTNSNVIRYTKESGYTDNAAMVAEGGLKPQSEITFTEVLSQVEKMADTKKFSMEILDDAPRLRSYVDGRGLYHLNLLEESQLLTGNGTTPNLHGILPQATAFDGSAGGVITGYTPATLIDEIRIAKLQARQALLPPSGVVMSPNTWAEIELLKDADNRYLYADIGSGATPRLWGMNVVESDSMDDGDFLVGGFSLGAQIWDRMGMAVMVSTEDQDNFVKNMITVRMEKRLGFEVTRPEAFIWKNAA